MLTKTKKQKFAVGRRKTSTAKITYKLGTGQIFINNKLDNLYFQYNVEYIKNSKIPLVKLNLLEKYDIFIFVKGGGLQSQSSSIKLAISRIISFISNIYRQPLKKRTFLTQDSRCKERKKYGLKKARKAPQFSKR